jgi:hypothetical protein
MNEVTPNPKMNKKARAARYGTRTGKMAPTADFAAPITKDQPIAVMDYRQYLINTRTNAVPDEFGVTNKSRLPMQNIAPPKGGKYSGRTGPI